MTKEANEHGLDMTSSYYLEMSKNALRRKGKIVAVQMARPVPAVWLKFRNQRAIVKDNNDLKKDRTNDVDFYQKNGCQYIDICTGSVHVSLVRKLFSHFSSHYLTEVFVCHALMHDHNQNPGSRELITMQRQKKLHIKHVK